MKGPVYWMSILEYQRLPQGIFPPGTMDISCMENILEAYASISLLGMVTPTLNVFVAILTTCINTDVQKLAHELFQSIRFMCVSIGTSGKELPPAYEEQKERVKRAISSYPVPPSVPNAQ